MKRLFGWVLGVALFGAAAAPLAFFYITKDLPDPQTFDRRKVAQSSKIYDREGQTLLYEIHGEEKRTVIPFAEIPALAKQATIAIEDAHFYEHPAFDWKSLVRATLVNLKSGRVVQGGSTITQQLAKKAFLTDDRTLTRKIKELALALQLEKRYAKDEILNLYLNQIPYGANAYGIAAASETYFKKPVHELNLAEIAVLASLPKAPSYYSPWGAHKDALLKRKDTVLLRMAELGFIAPSDAEAAKKQLLAFAKQITEIAAPHFVIAVQDYLNEQYGEDYVRTAGLKVITTLDKRLQEIAERAVDEGAKRNEELYEGKNAALVAEDAGTGQILALVGSRDYFDAAIDGNFNVATQGLRQPGSAMKPFAYLTAFTKGYTPDTVLFDLETEFDTTGEEGKSYKPQNFDEQFRGPIRMKEALAQSINVPAVKTLYIAGIDDVLKTAHDFGIGTLTERSRYGLSLVLGGGEVKPVELVGAYATLAKEGVRRKQALILRIEDASGKVIEEWHDAPVRVMEPQYPRIINEILSDHELRRPLFQNSFALTVFPDQEVALKTGTTNDYRDAWALGYSPSFVVGVWAGNNDNTPMQKHGTSILAAVPIWNTFMREALQGRPTETFTRPEPVFAEKPALRGDVIINNQAHDILYYVYADDPTGPIPPYPDADNQYKNWEEPVQEWLKTHPIEELKKTLPQTASGSISAAALEVASPVNGAFISGPIAIDASIRARTPIERVELRLNGQMVGVTSAQLLTTAADGTLAYRTQLAPINIELQNALNIKVVFTDGNTVEKEVILFR
ncbi:MAG: penicillin-binding protein [Candidatus Harrisonbacteria bacterium]|nr:penicillin-binding protein [Candidatus Harrisonbacteria bacterium]